MRAALLAVFLVCSSQASAADTCQALNAFMESGVAPSVAGFAKPRCGQALSTDGKASTYCYWSFDFRADDAADHMAALRKSVLQCGFQPGGSAGGAVNHPDSFDQELYERSGARLSLSLKDKGGLQKTLVFLRTN